MPMASHIGLWSQELRIGWSTTATWCRCALLGRCARQWVTRMGLTFFYDVTFF